MSNESTWKYREHTRFERGEYERTDLNRFAYMFLPKEKGQEFMLKIREVYKKHYPHIGLKDASLIEYTPNDSKGEADQQIAIKPGRFIKKFFEGMLTDVEIATLVGQYNQVNEDKRTLYIEKDPDKIVKVYLKGPNSCMSHPLSKFAGKTHPMFVIGAGDLAVAYIKKEKKITGRCIVWPDKKQHGRIYGDSGRISPLLASNGYTKDLNFSGAKLLKIPCGEKGQHTFILPYIDGELNVQITGDFLILNKQKGHQPCTSTNGLSVPLEYECAVCKIPMRSQDTRTIGSAARGTIERLCTPCAKEHTEVCRACSGHFRKETFTDVSGSLYCTDCVSHYAFTCDTCNSVKRNRYMSFDLDGCVCTRCTRVETKKIAKALKTKTKTKTKTTSKKVVKTKTPPVVVAIGEQEEEED